MTLMIIFFPLSACLLTIACYQIPRGPSLSTTGLKLIAQWSDTWQINLNPDKCITLTYTRSPSPQYFIYDRHLKVVDEHPYLGVVLHKSMSWNHHIQVITQKASKMLNFVKRTLYKCDGTVKATGYITLIRPTYIL